jgi:pterin-4a-carbinolamine dehydratase
MVKPRKPTPATERLKAERIQVLALKVPKWQLNREQTAISRLYPSFPGLRSAALFASLAAEIAESHDHTASILIEKGSVLVTLTTPGASGLTERDFDVASRLEFAA